MSKCGKYWQKVDDLENEIKGVKKELADVQRQLDAKPNDPAPFEKHKKVLEEKLKTLSKKYESAHLAAVNCEANSGY